MTDPALHLPDPVAGGARIQASSRPVDIDVVDWFRFQSRSQQVGVYLSRPSRGWVRAGTGAVDIAAVGAAGRFERTRQLAERIWQRTDWQDHRAQSLATCLTTHAFFDRDRMAGPWAGLPSNLVLVPRQLVVVRGGIQEMLTCESDWPVDGSPAVSRETERTASDPMSEVEWNRALSEAIGRIRSRRIDKVVLARTTNIRLDQPDPAALVRELELRFPDCLTYWVSWGDRSFIGATPERLVARRNNRVRSEAVAGTISLDRSGPDAIHRLERSLKDQSEHRFVVDAIREALDPVCDRLDIASAPVARTVGRLAHLRTRVSGELRGDIHVTELIDRLHPTPAVGGTPVVPAQRLISEIESFDRGWYAGPVGWFTRDGNGEYGVALRGGLMDGNVFYATAGAGIVSGSDPQSEWQETEAKFSGLTDALTATQ